MIAGKKALRREFALRRESLPLSERAEFDAAIRARLSGWSVFRSAPAVAAFAAFGAEPELLPLAKGKSWFLPRYSDFRKGYGLVEVRDVRRDLIRGRYGILEPRPELPELPEAEWCRLLFLVPAVACDRHGTRLGRGGGFYDRMLRAPATVAAAVVYGCQLSEIPLPCEEHDRRVNWIVTERAILGCGNGNG